MASAAVVQGHLLGPLKSEPLDALLCNVDVADDEDVVEEDIFGGDDGEDLDLADAEEVYDADDGTQYSEDTNKFDTIIGALEDIMMDPEFEMEREGFCRSNCSHFEETAENKLIYMDLFHKYTHMIESVIDSKLHEIVEGFSMAEFSEMLDARKDELDAEVFDLMLSMADFEAFRELMLAYRAEVVDGTSFEIFCTHLQVYKDEVEDGQHRPDLDLGLSVSGLSPRKS